MEAVREKRKERRRRKERRSGDIGGSERADGAAVVGREEIRDGGDEGGGTWSRAGARGMGAQAGDRRVVRAGGWVASVGIEREAGVEVGTMCRKIWKRCWRGGGRNPFVILV